MIITPFKGIGEVTLDSAKDEIKKLIGNPDINNREELEEGNFSEEWSLNDVVEKEFTTLKYSYWPVWTASCLTWINNMVIGFAIGGLLYLAVSGK